MLIAHSLGKIFPAEIVDAYNRILYLLEPFVNIKVNWTQRQNLPRLEHLWLYKLNIKYYTVLTYTYV